MLNDKIYLASQSPRRRQLIGYLFETPQILEVTFVEPKWKGESPRDLLTACVRSKWNQAQNQWNQNSGRSGLLVADTIVAHAGKVLGKPESTAEAFAMLSAMQGSWHTVFTGFRLGLREGAGRGGRGSDVVIVETAVKFRPIKAAEIKSYIRTREPMDKAGAYGLQERGLGFVERIRGPYTNVVGLPLECVRAEAAKIGFR